MEQETHRQETSIPQNQLPNIEFHFKINFGAHWGQRVESGTSSDQRNSESARSQPLIRQEFNFGSMPYPLRARQAEPHPEGHPHRHQAHHDESKTGQQGARPRETNPKADLLVDILGNKDL
ncbi:uncharacterized protein LOC133524750 [Cydia pomonella]|uniref:uncharacterized protein LOC133524750 n=1 Tax=Cydia pomonella TaxID=82600 RepID=UPI002ADE11A5|nr:uncharacterized protein LOC133524750 [Cydia pomonella]